jgi:hypothetical protein
MKLRHAIYANAALFAILSPISHSFAAKDNSNSQRNGRRGPPQVAIDACDSLSAGDACSFTGRNNEQMSGTCFAPQGRDLACKPEGHEGGQGRGKSGQAPGAQQTPE